MLNDLRLSQHPDLVKHLKNVEQDVQIGRNDMAAVDLRRALEYIIKSYWRFYGQDPEQPDPKTGKSYPLSELLYQLNKSKKAFDDNNNHLTRSDKSLFYDIKNLGNDEVHDAYSRPSVAKALSLYEDLQAFLPRFLEDIPRALTAPATKPAPKPPLTPRPAPKPVPAPAPKPAPTAPKPAPVDTGKKPAAQKSPEPPKVLKPTDRKWVTRVCYAYWSTEYQCWLFGSCRSLEDAERLSAGDVKQVACWLDKDDRIMRLLNDDEVAEYMPGFAQGRIVKNRIKH